MISKPSVSKDHRTAEIAGRCFHFFRRSYRLGHRNRRYTMTDWVITEHDKDGKLLCSVTQDGLEPHTVAAAEELARKFVGQS